MKTTKKSKNCWRRDPLTGPTQLSRIVLRKKLPSIAYTFSVNSERSRSIGGTTSKGRPGFVQTPVTTGFFAKALKTTYQFQCPLRSADGQALFTDRASILSQCSEHYQALFSANRIPRNQ